MNTKYSINQTTKALVFMGKPKSLNKDSVEKTDKDQFTSVVIPNSVSTIGGEAFEDCTSLASVHTPNSVSTVDYWAFADCISLASIHIPNSVSSILHEAFKRCSTLASVHIPNSVSSIGTWAFCDCLKLQKAYLSTNSKIKLGIEFFTFQPQTSLLRPRIKPITALQKKSACRACKTSYSIYL